MTDWRRPPRGDEPMTLGVRTLYVLACALGIAFVVVSALCALGCSAPPPSCPDRHACSHPIRVEHVELRCVDCDAYLGGSEVTRWDLRAR